MGRGVLGLCMMGRGIHASMPERAAALMSRWAMHGREGDQRDHSYVSGCGGQRREGSREAGGRRKGVVEAKARTHARVMVFPIHRRGAWLAEAVSVSQGSAASRVGSIGVCKDAGSGRRGRCGKSRPCICKAEQVYQTRRVVGGRGGLGLGERLGGEEAWEWLARASKVVRRDGGW